MLGSSFLRLCILPTGARLQPPQPRRPRRRRPESAMAAQAPWLARPRSCHHGAYRGTHYILRIEHYLVMTLEFSEKRGQNRETLYFWALRESVYIYTSLPSPLRSTRFSFLFVGLAYRAGCSLSARYLSFSTRARPSADFTVTRDPICTCPKVAFIYLSSILR